MKKINFYIIISIFFIGFFKGTMALLGLNETITQASIDFLIIILFSSSIISILKRKKLIAPYFVIFMFLTTTILISFLFSDVKTILLIVFLRKFYLYFLFFYALFNIELTRQQIEKLKKLILILFAIQVPAALIKLFTIGIREKIVGTMSIAEGSLATIMPLLAIAYYFSTYLYRKRLKYTIGIILFLGVGLMSGKKAIIFYMIILFLYMVYIQAHPKFFIPRMVFFKKLLFIVVLTSILFPLFISLHPRLNPEHKFGGSIDFDYISKYVQKYNTKKPSSLEGEGQGRFDAPAVVFSRLDDGGLLKILLGFGPGEIVKSGFSKYHDPLLEKYNIGYGGRQGWLWISMQIGTIGMIIIALFHILILKRLIRISKETSLHEDEKIIVLSAIGFIIIYLLDYFSYSRNFMTNPGVAATFYFTLYYIFTQIMVPIQIKNKRYSKEEKDLQKSLI